MANEVGQVVAQALFLVAQVAIDQHRVGRLKARSHQRARRACGALAVEPADMQAEVLADAMQTHPSRQRQLAPAAPTRPHARYRESRCGAFPARRESAIARIAARWCRSGTSSSGSAFCSSSCENRNAGSSGMASRPPRSRCAGTGSTAVFSSRNQRASLPNNPRQHVQQIGRRHALAVLDHAQVGHRGRGARRRVARSAPTAHPASGHCACAASSAWCPRKCPWRINPLICEIHTVKFLLCKSSPFIL